MKRIAIILSSFACVAALTAVGADAPKANSYTGILSVVPAAEMPAKAAELVKQTKARNWSTVTVQVVKAAVRANPASAPAVVSAISGKVPEMAPVAAGTAAGLQPKQAVAIAKAAAAAAPAKASKIAVAVARAVPASLRAVAVAASEAAPGSNRAVLAAVAAAFPELKASIESALAANLSDSPPVALIVEQAMAAAAAVASASDPSGARGPVISAPFVTPPPGPTSLDPSTSIPSGVPGAPRPYAKP